MEGLRSTSGLTSSVMAANGVSEEEANEMIKEQASYCMDLMASDDLDIEDVEDAMMDMGIEPDYMDEFLLRFC